MVRSLQKLLSFLLILTLTLETTGPACAGAMGYRGPAPHSRSALFACEALSGLSRETPRPGSLTAAISAEQNLMAALTITSLYRPEGRMSLENPRRTSAPGDERIKNILQELQAIEVHRAKWATAATLEEEFYRW